MRKAQKVQIEGFVRLLEEAHAEIKKGLKKRAFENVLLLLEKCQQETIQLGKLIEDSEGEGLKTVADLEEYCELLYLLYEEIVHGNSADCMKLYKKLRHTLIQIENGIKYEIKIRREIVFFPYKASMWDSLESVWRAAAREEECDVYVVPIPYFDKNPDGTLGKMHYEGGQYPEDVPVVSWLKYRLEDRRPDIVFIHNPYDECNLVTSVHPDYYASELKKYTDMLVYISYFVAVNDKVEGHFCRNPGIYLADKVVVQSEAVRSIYVNELRQCEKEYNCKGAFGDIDGKILALGSPKYDRAVSAGRKGEEIPEEWKPLLFHADGRRKKAVLYNTTVDGMLRHSDKMLLKIKNVLRQFEEERDSVLLWRPHPLLLASLESMRSEMAGEYREIVEEYKNSKAGIYDDSADMYRAIAVSDAYYGDMSSVVELYKHTGKPILIQSADYDGNNGLVFQAFAQVDEYTAYASCSLFNGLFKVDLRTGNCTYIGMFQREPEDGFTLHAKAAYVNGNIYFIPSAAGHISIFCIETGKIEDIPLEGAVRKFSDAVPYDDSLFLICSDRCAIFRMRLHTGEIKCCAEWVPGDGIFFSGNSVQSGSVLYIPNREGNTVLEFHMDSCMWKIHQIGDDRCAGWGSICKGGDSCWLVPRIQGPVIRWNPGTGEEESYDQFPDGFQANRFLFSRGYVGGGYVKLLPAYANMAVKLSLASGEITQFDFGQAESGYEIIALFEAGQYIYFTKAKENSVGRGLLAWNSYEHFRLNMADDSVERFRFSFSEGRERFQAEHERYINQMKGNQSIGRECLFFDMRELLRQSVAGIGSRTADGEAQMETAGEVIYKTILKLADREEG